MAATIQVLIISAIIAIYTCQVQSAKILLYPGMGKSHIMGMTRIGQELAKRNHKVTILLGSPDKVKRTSDLNYATYEVPYEEDFLEKVIVPNMLNGSAMSWFFGNMSAVSTFEVYCKSLMDDKKLVHSFKDYDLLISDAAFYCGGLLGARLGIRKVEYFPYSPRVPRMFKQDESFLTLSYLPQMFTQNPEKMSLLQRLKNVLLFWSMKVVQMTMFYPSIMRIKVQYAIKPEKSLVEIFNDKELTLFMSDFAFEYPHPMRPDYKLIGPVSVQPVQPLPSDLQQLIDSSGDDGVVIVSFGSNVASLFDKDKIDILAEAFGKLKQKVIWRLKGYKPSSLRDNILVRDWIPQNDLLANKKLRAFVSHVGMNGMYEALYYGVPVVAVPLYGDQFDNAVQMLEIGVALISDYKTLTAEDLYNNLQRVIHEPSFRHKAQRISRLMQDRPRSPVQEAGDWIEYALRHESLAHLRPYSSQLAWYQYFLVDVAVFLVLVVLVVIMVIKYTVRLFCWMCCRRDKKQKTQ